jgi:hypothetical protein
MCGGEDQCHRSPLAVGDERHLIESCLVEGGEGIVDPLFDEGEAVERDGIRNSGPALVEHQHPSESPEL